MGQRNLILLVEDDEFDARAVKRALEELKSPKHLVHLRNGSEALDYLRSDLNTLPFLILLDLNMPRMDGHAFLKTIKSDKDLQVIPVIVLTTSGDIKDIDKSFHASVAGYMTKPVQYEEFVEKIGAIDAYWRINRLPGESLEVDE